MTEPCLWNIKGKEVWVVENHNEALYPWCKYRRTLLEAPDLLTLDYHTDTHDPFACYLSCKHNGMIDDNEIGKLLDEFDYHEDVSVTNAINKLKNDEQIWTGLKKDVLNHALVIAYDCGPKNIPKSEEEKYDEAFYQDPKNMIRISLGEISMLKHEHPYHYNIDDERVYIPNWEGDKESLVDQVLEDVFLNKQLSFLGEMNQNLINDEGLINNRYILDIDLDYFYNEASLQPVHANTFYNLIRNAGIITIATEPNFVDICGDGKITAEQSLEKIREHIKKAMI